MCSFVRCLVFVACCLLCDPFDVCCSLFVALWLLVGRYLLLFVARSFFCLRVACSVSFVNVVCCVLFAACCSLPVARCVLACCLLLVDCCLVFAVCCGCL